MTMTAETRIKIGANGAFCVGVFFGAAERSAEVSILSWCALVLACAPMLALAQRFAIDGAP